VKLGKQMIMMKLTSVKLDLSCKKRGNGAMALRRIADMCGVTNGVGTFC